MSFLTPWVALGLAAVVIPTLVIFYFLKLRRKQETVASTFLWRRAVQDLQVNAPFQRLRKNLLLLLQLLVLIAALLALARPIIKTDFAREKSLILMLDRSASMNTREADGRTRLDEAKEQAKRLVKSLNKTGSTWYSWLGGQDAMTRVMLVAFADRATVLAPFTTNTSDLVGLIDGLEPTDAATNLREALELAQAYMMPGRGNIDIEVTPGQLQNPINPESTSRMVLFSDGCVGNLGDVALQGGNVTLMQVGQARDNVGITALRTQRNYEKPEILSVFVQVKNFGDEPVSTDVSLYVNGRLGSGRIETVKLSPIRRSQSAGGAQTPAPEVGEPASPPDTPQPETEKGGSTAALTFEMPVAEAAELEARLSRDDPFMVDNRAFAIVPPPRELKVLLVSERNDFLQAVLQNLAIQQPYRYLTPQQYESAPAAQVESDGRSLYDVVIFDKHETARLPLGNYLFLGALPKIPAVKSAGDAEPFAMMWWDDTHPVLRYVGLDYELVGKAIKLDVPKEAQTLMEGPHGPTLVRMTDQGRQFLILSFAVEHSTMRVKNGFPIFMFNAVRFLGAGTGVTDREVVRPGDSVLFAVPGEETAATVVRPDSRKATVRVDAQQLARYGATDRVGVYRIEPGAPGRDRVAVNLEDVNES
ncbi:MAG: vWA domain-containing protein, partial [Phycisphaerae bacterium]